MKWRTEIQIEKREITIIRANKKRKMTFCENCGMQVPAFAPEKIAEVLQIELDEVVSSIEINKLHLVKNGRSVALICGNSLKQNKNWR